MNTPSGRDRITHMLARTASIDDVLAAWPATAGALTELRSCLHDWLSARAWPKPAAQLIVLAVNEAATNVVEHAYGPGETSGRIEMYAWEHDDPQDADHRRVGVVVADTGEWQPGTPLRGRLGLALIRDLMLHHHVERTDRGTCVTFISHAVPALDGASG